MPTATAETCRRQPGRRGATESRSARFVKRGGVVTPAMLEEHVRNRERSDREE